MSSKPKTLDRILDAIEAAHGATSVALLSSDLKLATTTVWRHVRDLEAKDRVAFGWDGNSLELSDSERKTRSEDRAFRATLPLSKVKS